MEAIDKIKKLLESDSLSRVEVLKLTGDIEVAIDDSYKDKNKLQEELTEIKRKLEDTKEEVIIADTLLEEGILDEFKERFICYKKGSLSPNLILHNYTAI